LKLSSKSSPSSSASFERLQDSARRRKASTKPEEKVRQALTRWLLEQVGVPPRLLSVEYSLSALDPKCRKRADIVVWKPGGKEGGLCPWLLVECKAPGIALNDTVADQVRRYAEKIHAPFVLVTSGDQTRIFKVGKISAGKGNYEEVERLPVFG
jgi:hypothetical protein